MVMVMVINSALVRTHQSTYSGSFGPVLLPGWVGYTRSRYKTGLRLAQNRIPYTPARQPCLKMWRGSPDLHSRRNAHF